MGHDHERLLEQAIDGDEQATGALLEHFAPQLARQLRIKHPQVSRPDAEDVLQITFLEAVLNIHRFDPERTGSFVSWLSRIMECNVSDLVRGLHRGKRPPPERQLHRSADESCTALLDLLTADSATPSRHAAATEAHRFVQQALAELPDDYRKVVELYDLAGHDVEQVVNVMGRSRGAVYMLRARALDRLREALGNDSRFFSRGA